MTRMVDRDLGPQAAVEAPRWLFGEPWSDLMGHAQVIAIDSDGALRGASDPRADGAAVGR